MTAKLLMIIVVVCFTLGGAQADEETPGVALLSFGLSPAPYSVTENAILRLLHLHGFISDEAYRGTVVRRDIEGERLRVFAHDANWDLDRLNIMVETAIDRGADVLIAFTTPVAQAAVNATQDMDDPPIVIFASTYYPFEAGLADAPCVKPAHVTGSQILPPYAELLAALKQQQPEAAAIGVLYSLDQLAGVQGARTIEELAEAQGLAVAGVGVVQPVDLNVAVEALAGKGAQALVLPIDTITSRGLPNIAAVANEYQIPLYFPSLGAVQHGAMITVGYYRQVEQGYNVARILIAWLNGELDIATTAIGSVSGDSIGLNLDTAAKLGMVINPQLLDAATVTIANGDVKLSDELTASTQELDAYLTVGNRADIDRQYLESLHCSPEMIAEQQAALESE